jgi:hypothetical protein
MEPLLRITFFPAVRDRDSDQKLFAQSAGNVQRLIDPSSELKWSSKPRIRIACRATYVRSAMIARAHAGS